MKIVHIAGVHNLVSNCAPYREPHRAPCVQFDLLCTNFRAQGKHDRYRRPKLGLATLFDSLSPRKRMD